ncbi:MAG: tetratricopeptide repeat-containing sensor histidine kinase [Cyclobacteriaceae bacterium]
MEKTVQSIRGKIQAILDEAYAKRINNLAESIRLANKALGLSKEAENNHLTGRCLNQLSLYHMIVGDYDLSINIAEEAISHFTEDDDERGIADAKYNIAGALYKTDNFNLGLTYLIDCLTTYRKFDDHHNLARVHKSMGTIFEFFGDEKSAIQSYQEAISSGEAINDMNLQSNAFNPLSGIFLNQGKVDEALDLIEKSIDLKSESKDTRGLAFALYGRGKVFTKTGNYEQAEKDFLESLRIHEEMGEKLGHAMSYHKLGALYIAMGRLEDAREILVKALQYSNKHKVILIKFKANLLLHEVAKREKNYELALKYLTQYVEEKESVINDKTAKVIESYEVIKKVQELEREALSQKEKADLNEKKNLELDSFFYRISHDLKGPITAMMSLGYLAKEDVSDETALNYFEEYSNQAKRVNNILDELMNLTKMVYDTEAKSEIDFEQLVYDCIASYKHLQNFEKVEFKVNIQENIKFEAEWALVNTIIQNLVENGIKYARVDDDRSKIEITITNSPSNIGITITDNGIGMSEDAQSKIFKMFYRADRRIEGTGLGLHIVSRAIEKLDGEVEVESELGVGSTFRVLLPKV